MSEPVDIVAAGREAVERIVCYDALSMDINGRRDSDIVSELCDKVERLQAREAKILKLHTPFPIYEECGHDGDCPTEPIEIDGEFFTCEEGFMYFVCFECCVVNDYQHEDCAGGHDHGKDIPICATVALLTTLQTGDSND